MKKLRPSISEKAKLIEDITEHLAGFKKGTLEDFDIENIKKEYLKVPENVVKPRLVINPEVYIMMLELINQSSVECSWHGLVEKMDNRTYRIYEILVFPQINSATSTTTDEGEFAEWQTKLIMDPNFPIQNLRMHGHSHVNMNVFSSGVDDQYQKDLITKVDDGDYYIFLIMNKKMEMCAFIYDFAQQVLFETSDIEIIIPFETIKVNGEYEFPNIREWAKKELKEKATTERIYSYQRDKNNRYPIRYYEEDDYCNNISYFSNSKPIFKGVKNGSK